jgi:acyl carrier protein|tara:strand:- start:237 stop:980 length:744 start_codon:yes stop_codon:yes gene_type:complete
METQKILQSFEVKDELNSEIWDYTASENDKEPQLKPEIDDRLLEISDNFINFLGVDVDVEDITMTGSLSNYNWSSFSDIDLHVLIDFESSSIDKKVLRELFNAKQGVWNSLHDIEVYGFEVELYAQDANEPHFSTGVYSVLNNEWLVSPNRLEDTWDDQKLLQKSLSWMEMIDGVERKSHLEEPEDALKLIQKIKDKLKKFRKCGLEDKGEFSYENLVFKFLRRNGYLRKLSELKNKITDEALSLEE